MASTAPKRRRSDRGWRRLIRENAYRDVWLLLVTGLLLWALISIQNERWNNVRRSCETDNQHYTTTIAKLDELLAGIPKSQQARTKASKDSTIALIATLAPPHFDAHGRSTCKQVADQAVSRWP